MGTAAHRMRGDETGTECPAWFKLLCGQVGQLRVPGLGKYGTARFALEKIITMIWIKRSNVGIIFDRLEMMKYESCFNG